MPSKKRRGEPPREPLSDPVARLEVLLEDLRDQSRATAEAADRNHQELKQDMRELEERLTTRIDTLGMAVRTNSGDIRDLRAGLTRVEVRVESVEGKVDRLEAKVDQLVPPENRVAALERRGA